MVRVSSVAVLAIALISSTAAIAHPKHRVSKHHAIARRASTSKTTISKAAACSAINAKRAKASLTASGSASATASSASPSATSGNDGQTQSGTTTSASLLALLPASGVQNGWTVAGHNSTDVDSLELSDDTFDITKEMKEYSHDVVTVDGKKAIHGHVEKGSVALETSAAPGGFSFYTPGPKDSKLDLTKAKEVSFGYSVKFSKGYDWNLGGKLPGLYGGVDEDTAATCSGGRHDDGCFSCRFMWRADGKGELYLYIPPDANRDNLCGDDGFGKCREASDNGKTYGASIGTGNFMFQDGEWVSLRQVVHLNTPGKRDGWVKVYVNGSSKPIIYAQEISFRNSGASVVRGLQVQYFHGGHESEWAAPKDQDIWVSGLSVAITQYAD